MTEPQTASDFPSTKLWAVVPILTVLAILGTVGFARFVGLATGPFGGDERYVVLHALKFGTGDLNPRHFDWPASALYYLTFFLDGAYFVGGYLSGRFRDTAAFAVESLADPRVFYLIPRAVSATFGIGTAFLLM